MSFQTSEAPEKPKSAWQLWRTTALLYCVIAAGSSIAGCAPRSLELQSGVERPDVPVVFVYVLGRRIDHGSRAGSGLVAALWHDGTVLRRAAGIGDSTSSYVRGTAPKVAVQDVLSKIQDELPAIQRSSEWMVNGGSFLMLAVRTNDGILVRPHQLRLRQRAPEGSRVAVGELAGNEVEPDELANPVVTEVERMLLAVELERVERAHGVPLSVCVNEWEN